MTSPRRVRLDVALVERGLCDSREQAQAAIAAGLVRLDDRPARKPAQAVSDGSSLAAEAPHPWVSRGGVKLRAALDAFGLDPRGLDCLDVGASTGGFTDVLLSAGARTVIAIDVGHGQLHPRIAGDPRVRVRERTDGRALHGIVVQASIGLTVVDVSFISLRLVLPGLVPLLAAGASLVALVKPQFEVGRDGIRRGGIVRDEKLGREAVDGIAALLPQLGLTLLGRIESPITGGDGNREALLGARRA